MSKSSPDKKTVESLLSAPYPIDQTTYKTVYTKCGRMWLTQLNLYQCNFCMIKVMGDMALLEHNKSFNHQTEMQKKVEEMLQKVGDDKNAPSIKLSETAKEKLEEAAIQTAKVKMSISMVELKTEYEQYRLHPNLHPMYIKEWQIFYLRKLSDLMATNIDPRTYDFTKDWSAYWVKRIQVYYNEALEKIINTIGANYILTVADTKTNGLLAKNNGQHSNGGAKDEHSVESKSNGIRANKDLDNGTVVPVNGTSANNAPANDDLKNSDCSNDNSNVDRFSITNSETVSNGDDNDNDEEDVNKIDSRATTEDEASDGEIEFNIEEEEESEDDSLTSRFRGPQDLIDEARKLSSENFAPMATNENINEEPMDVVNEINDKIDSDAVADSVTAFFQSVGINPANLSDEEVEKFIKLFVEQSLTKPANDRAGSVETLTSSDSNDESWRLR